MEPKLLMGALLLGAVALATLVALLRGGTRAGAGLDAPLTASLAGGPGVVQAAIQTTSPSSLPTARSRDPGGSPRPLGVGPTHAAATDASTAAPSAETAAQAAALAARLDELERENQNLRFRLAEADRRLAAAAAREVTDFLGGVRACLDEGFGPDDFVLVAGGERIDLRQDLQGVLFDVARHLRTQDLAALRRVADDGRLRQALAVLDVFHRRRLVDGVEDWGGRKRQLNAIFALPVYPGA